MTLSISAALIWLFVSPLVAGAQDMDDAAIERAIKAGQDDKFGQWSAQCKADVSFGDKRREGGSWTRDSVHFTGAYEVLVLTNSGRIAFLAADAKRHGKSFAVADVPRELRAAALHVLVDPITPGRDWGGGVEVPSPITRIVLRSKSQPVSEAEPGHLEVSDVQWSEGRTIMMRLKPGGGVEKNLFGRSRATATIAIEAVAALPAGDIEIVVVTTGAERRCDLRAKERVRLVR